LLAKVKGYCVYVSLSRVTVDVNTGSSWPKNGYIMLFISLKW